MTALYSTKLFARTALFAALTAVCSQLAVPMPWGVPINLATMAVFLAAALLPLPYAVASQAVYLALGMLGAPVFSAFRGGFDVLVGPTGGYLVGYLLAVALTGGLLCLGKRTGARYVFAMVVGLLGCYALGTAWFMYLMQMDLMSALWMCVIPYLIGDGLKIAVATTLALRLQQTKLFA